MLIIFDCDGVIVDSMLTHATIEAKALAELGIHKEPSELARRFSGVAYKEQLAILSEESGIKIPDTFVDYVEEMKAESFSRDLMPVHGVSGMLDAIAPTPLCIASGTCVSGLDHMLRVVGLYDRFAPHIYSAEMVARGKPFPDLFLHAANQMGYKPDDCIVIEDATAGVTAAKAAGMRAFGFTGGGHTDEDHEQRLTQAGADLVFSSMDQLSALIR